jgi:hypothetical protein
MWSNGDMKEKHLIQTAIIDLQQEQEKSDNLEIIGFFTSQGRKSILGVHKNKDIFFGIKLKFIMFESRKKRLCICTQLLGALIIDDPISLFGKCHFQDYIETLFFCFFSFEFLLLGQWQASQEGCSIKLQSVFMTCLQKKIFL